MTAMAVLPPIVKKAHSQTNAPDASNTSNLMTGDLKVTGQRTLGTGPAAMTVSALGFGCMGLNYHRSIRLDKKQAFYLLHRAVDTALRCLTRRKRTALLLTKNWSEKVWRDTVIKLRLRRNSDLIITAIK